MPYQSLSFSALRIPLIFELSRVLCMTCVRDMNVYVIFIRTKKKTTMKRRKKKKQQQQTLRSHLSYCCCHVCHSKKQQHTKAQRNKYTYISESLYIYGVQIRSAYFMNYIQNSQWIFFPHYFFKPFFLKKRLCTCHLVILLSILFLLPCSVTSLELHISILEFHCFLFPHFLLFFTRKKNTIFSFIRYWRSIW